MQKHASIERPATRSFTTSSVIGEAAAQIGHDTRSDAPEIPWSKVVGLRNLIAHEYFRVDLEVIEAIVSEQLDELERTAKRLLEHTQ